MTFSTINTASLLSSYLPGDIITVEINSDSVFLEKSMSAMAIELDLSLSTLDEVEINEKFYNNIMYSGYHKTSEVPEPFNFDDEFLYITFPETTLYMEDIVPCDDKKLSFQVSNRIPKFTYGTLNNYPIKINHYLIIFVFKDSKKKELHKIRLNVLACDYRELKHKISHVSFRKTNPFASDYDEVVANYLLNPNMLEYFNEIFGKSIKRKDACGEFIIKTGDKHLATIRLAQAILSIGKSISGEIILAEKSKVFKVATKVFFKKSVYYDNKNCKPEISLNYIYKKEFVCCFQKNVPFDIPCHFSNPPSFKCNIMSIEWFMEFEVYSYDSSLFMTITSPISANIQEKTVKYDQSKLFPTKCLIPLTLTPVHKLL